MDRAVRLANAARFRSPTLVGSTLENGPDGLLFLSDRQPTQDDGHLTNLLTRRTAALADAAHGVGTQKGEVMVVRTGPTALEMASTSRPDVVLLNIGLPRMDGNQVAQYLQEVGVQRRDDLRCDQLTPQATSTTCVTKSRASTTTSSDSERHEQLLGGN